MVIDRTKFGNGKQEEKIKLGTAFCLQLCIFIWYSDVGKEGTWKKEEGVGYEFETLSGPSPRIFNYYYFYYYYSSSSRLLIVMTSSSRWGKPD